MLKKSSRKGEINNMDIQEAKNILDRSSKLHLQVDREPNKFDIAIQTVLEELEKKDKIIDKMAEKLAEDKEWFYSEFDKYIKQGFIKYFTNLVEKENK